MVVLRPVKESDIDSLFQLSKLVQFLNLPRDRSIIEKKVLSSVKSFKNPAKKVSDNHFIFVLEDTSNEKVIGVSMIHGQHGTFERPHFFLKVGEEKTFSESLKKRIAHQTLKLGVETDGPTEIGGLVLHPDYRKNVNKLGKQLSYIRFLYMAYFPEYFREEVHSELMPPLDENGNSPLWEAIGRRFFNMDYHEADKLSLTNKEFILNLFPNGTIYTSLLSPEAQESIGKVGKDTLPVKKMLEDIGFKYNQEVDPFDGGPHYRAKLKDIKIAQNLFNGLMEYQEKINNDQYFLVAQFNKNDFVAFRVRGEILNNKLFVNVKELPVDFKDSVVAIPC